MIRKIKILLVCVLFPFFFVSMSSPSSASMVSFLFGQARGVITKKEEEIEGVGMSLGESGGDDCSVVLGGITFA